MLVFRCVLLVAAQVLQHGQQVPDGQVWGVDGRRAVSEHRVQDAREEHGLVDLAADAAALPALRVHLVPRVPDRQLDAAEPALLLLVARTLRYECLLGLVLVHERLVQLQLHGVAVDGDADDLPDLQPLFVVDHYAAALCESAARLHVNFRRVHVRSRLLLLQLRSHACHGRLLLRRLRLRRRARRRRARPRQQRLLQHHLGGGRARRHRLAAGGRAWA
mmetsp:Transcript_114715/g.356284  ORF Transcript_114715/g.356284 Transcript_114715/m.356284 type:complete len:219 (-) Transcript_114715:13-669(-)